MTRSHGAFFLISTAIFFITIIRLYKIQCNCLYGAIMTMTLNPINALCCEK